MLEKLKEWFFYRDFKIQPKKDIIHKSILNTEQTICILFDGTNEEDRKSIHRLKKILNPLGNKSIKSLAFLNNSFPLDNVDYAAYNHKTIKWHGVPFGEKVEEFLNLHFDLLIVLCKNMLPHFEYIIAHSSASFVVGPHLNKSEKYFNLIIESEYTENLFQLSQLIIKGIEKISVK